MPVPDFSPGEVLTAAAMDAVGLWLVKTQTIGTAVSSVTVTNAFSANYDNYKITISGGVGSTGANLQLRLGSSATGYYSSLFFKNYNAVDGTSVEAYQNNNGTFWTRAALATPDNIFGNIELFSPNQAKVTGITASYMAAQTISGAGSFSGFHNVATAFTEFSLTPSAGTLTGGTIRVYGYRN